MNAQCDEFSAKQRVSENESNEVSEHENTETLKLISSQLMENILLDGAAAVQ